LSFIQLQGIQNRVQLIIGSIKVNYTKNIFYKFNYKNVNSLDDFFLYVGVKDKNLISIQQNNKSSFFFQKYRFIITINHIKRKFKKIIVLF